MCSLEINAAPSFEARAKTRPIARVNRAVQRLLEFDAPSKVSVLATGRRPQGRSEAIAAARRLDYRCRQSWKLLSVAWGLGCSAEIIDLNALAPSGLFHFRWKSSRLTHHTLFAEEVKEFEKSDFSNGAFRPLFPGVIECCQDDILICVHRSYIVPLCSISKRESMPL
jgi:hypothetical protein